jgi:hypothetical protein
MDNELLEKFLDEYLTANLKIECKTEFFCDTEIVKVKVYLKDKVISTDYFSKK